MAYKQQQADKQYAPRKTLRIRVNELELKDHNGVPFISMKAGVAPDDTGNPSKTEWMNLDVGIWPGKNIDDPDTEIATIARIMQNAIDARHRSIVNGTIEEKPFKRKDGTEGMSWKVTVYPDGIYVPYMDIAEPESNDEPDEAEAEPPPVAARAARPATPARQATRQAVAATTVYPAPTDLILDEQVYIIRALATQHERFGAVPGNYRTEHFNPPTTQLLSEILSAGQADELIAQFYDLAEKYKLITKAELKPIADDRAWLLDQARHFGTEDDYADVLDLLNQQLTIVDDAGKKYLLDDYSLAVLALPATKLAVARTAIQGMVESFNVTESEGSTVPVAVGAAI